MKIYNEIVIDMNPDSSSYNEVLYEDSYKYNGDIVLCISEEEMRKRWKRGLSDINADGGTNVLDIVKAANFASQEGKGIESAQDIAGATLAGTNIDQFTLAESAANKPPEPIASMSSQPLPSLPSISNVGTISPTGTVNRQAIPGGFQPLPQVAGGKKKLYQLSQFHGGINQKSHPRDISDQECQEATNVTFSKIGAIKPLGHILNTDNSITVSAVHGHTGSDMGCTGHGLFQFTAPADRNDTVGEEVLTLTADGDQVDVFSAGDGNEAGWIDMNGNDNHAVTQVYYAAGNGVYVCDGNFNNADNKRNCAIYVSRGDINGGTDVAGWVHGNNDALIPSPVVHASTATYVELKSSHGNAGATGRMEVFAAGHASDTGTWNGTYTFYASWLFDGGCETGLSALGTSAPSNKTLDFNISIQHTSAAPLGGTKRIEGARIYFKPPGESERYLLAEMSLVDGIKGATDTTFQPWENPTGTTYDIADAAIRFENPPAIYTFASLNGYYANEVYTKSPDTYAASTGLDLRYKTAVVGAGGVVYVGNVKFNGEHKPDAMMFSMPGKPGIFPKFNTFDSPSSDGSPIRALAAFQDTILQFKENSLFVINVSNPQQFYAEQIYRDCGVHNPCQVFTTSFGVIFANKHGCFMYDGRGVISLTSGKFDVADWGLSESYAVDVDGANVPCVGYDPRSQNIIVLKDIGDNSNNTDSWTYNMTTQSWTEGSGVITNGTDNRHTNFIITSAGYLSNKRDNNTSILNYNHDKATATADETITYITKDLDFGLPSQTKKIFKVYVTYYSDDASVPTLTYGKDGAAPTSSFDSGAFASSGGLQTTEFKVTDTDLTGIKSISLKVNGSTDHSFEIQDISILFRARPIK